MGLFGFGKVKNVNAAGEVFEKHYRNMLRLTSQTPWKTDAKFELIPAMFVICDYATASARKDRRAVADAILVEINSLCKYNENTFDRRVDLYGEVIRGKSLRGEWALGNIEPWCGNAVMIVTAVLGDILCNPDCADNYDKAPLLIRGIDEYFSFATGVMNPVASEMAELFKEIYQL